MTFFASATKQPTVHVVLHGGLGNQLFQYFQGLARAYHHGARELRLLTGLLGRYTAQRKLEIFNLLPSECGSVPIRQYQIDPIARLRIPKVIAKLTGSDVSVRLPAYGVLLDGYFQELRFYLAFDLALLTTIIARWRAKLTSLHLLNNDVRDSVVIHLRLKDFFTSSASAKEFARHTLALIQTSADIVTDDEQIATEVLRDTNMLSRFSLIPTRDLSAWQVLATLARYSHIRTNGSSLAFWAAIFSDSNFESTTSAHVELWRHLLQRH